MARRKIYINSNQRAVFWTTKERECFESFEEWVSFLKGNGVY